MERFAKRKIQIFPARDDLTGQDMVRVFFKPDEGRAFHLGDYPRCYSKELIYEKVKEAYRYGKTHAVMTRYKVVQVESKVRDAVVDVNGHIKFWDSKEAAQKWIDEHSYNGMSFKYEVVPDEANN